jgi:hypothetical protein
LHDGGGDQPRRLRALDAQLSHVLAAEAHIASVCVRDADDDETVGAIVETVEASQRLLTAWRARVAAAPGEARRRQRARAAEEARVAAARAAVPALSKSARMAAAAAAAARREGEQRAARALAIAQATRVLDAAANAGVRPALVRGGVRRRAAGSSAAAADMQRAVTVRAAVAAAARATAAASSVLRGGSGGVLAVATEAARAGAIVGRLCGQVVRAATVAVRGVAVASGGGVSARAMQMTEMPTRRARASVCACKRWPSGEGVCVHATVTTVRSMPPHVSVSGRAWWQRRSCVSESERATVTTRMERAKAAWCARAAWWRRGAHRHPTTVAVGYYQAAGQCSGHACVRVRCMVPPRSDSQVLASCVQAMAMRNGVSWPLRMCESSLASRVESRLIRFAGPRGHWPAHVGVPARRGGTGPVRVNV